jgi:thiamine kinase-like enzyme
LWNADTQDLKIVDYEFASMNDVCSDLATLSTSAMLYDDQDEELVEYYFGELDEFQFAQVQALQTPGHTQGMLCICNTGQIQAGCF